MLAKLMVNMQVLMEFIINDHYRLIGIVPQSNEPRDVILRYLTPQYYLVERQNDRVSGIRATRHEKALPGLLLSHWLYLMYGPQLEVMLGTAWENGRIPESNSATEMMAVQELYQILTGNDLIEVLSRNDFYQGSRHILRVPTDKPDVFLLADRTRRLRVYGKHPVMEETYLFTTQGEPNFNNAYTLMANHGYDELRESLTGKRILANVFQRPVTQKVEIIERYALGDKVLSLSELYQRHKSLLGKFIRQDT